MAWDLDIKRGGSTTPTSYPEVDLEFLRVHDDYQFEALRATQAGLHIATLLLREMYFNPKGISADGENVSLIETQTLVYEVGARSGPAFWELTVS